MDNQEKSGFDQETLEFIAAREASQDKNRKERAARDKTLRDEWEKIEPPGIEARKPLVRKVIMDMESLKNLSSHFFGFVENDLQVRQSDVEFLEPMLSIIDGLSKNVRALLESLKEEEKKYTDVEKRVNKDGTLRHE